MDRRNFLKASMFGVGATMVGVPEILAKEPVKQFLLLGKDVSIGL